MKQQKLVQIRLDYHLNGNESVELSISKYLEAGWTIVSYQVCPESHDCGDVVVLLEKDA